jgi:hypothetical protein
MSSSGGGSSSTGHKLKCSGDVICETLAIASRIGASEFPVFNAAKAWARQHSTASTLATFSEQKRARSHGEAGIPGILGNLESVSYRF